MSRCERQQASANSTRSWFELLTMTLRPSNGQRPGDLRVCLAQVDGHTLEDTTTLTDPTVVAKLKEQYEEE